MLVRETHSREHVFVCLFGLFFMAEIFENLSHAFVTIHKVYKSGKRQWIVFWDLWSNHKRNAKTFPIHLSFYGVFKVLLFFFKRLNEPP